jgi:hypothetical protein
VRSAARTGGLGNVALARELLSAGHGGDDERLRLALPELMAAAHTALDRDEVQSLVERLLYARRARARAVAVDMRAAERAGDAALAWAVARPDLVAGIRRDHAPLPAQSDDWLEELMLTLAACWQVIAAQAPDAHALVQSAVRARRRERRMRESRWLSQVAPGAARDERTLRAQAARALLDATGAAAAGDGALAQQRLAHVRRLDALGLLGLGHLARELATCVRFRLGAEPE